MVKKKGSGVDSNSISRRRFLELSGVACGAAILGSWGTRVEMAFGLDPFPSRKVTWIVGTTAGGGKDQRVRLITPFLQKYLVEGARKQDRGNVKVVVKNVAGSSGIKAIDFIHHATPDGYNLLLGSEILNIHSAIGLLGFDPLELTYIANISPVRKVLTTSAKSNLKTWDDVVKAAKQRPLRIGATGFSGSNHVAALLFINASGLNAKPVIFEGASGLAAALLRQDVQLGMDSEDACKGLVDAQEIRPIITFSKKTIYKASENVKDIGYPELNDTLSGQNYVVAPPRLPQDVKKCLCLAFQKAMSDGELLALSKKMGIELEPLQGPDFDNYIKNIQKYYISKSNILKEVLRRTS